MELSWPWFPSYLAWPWDLCCPQKVQRMSFLVPCLRFDPTVSRGDSSSRGLVRHFLLCVAPLLRPAGRLESQESNQKPQQVCCD
eukprot:6488514-Amphidinium_carterae.2